MEVLTIFIFIFILDFFLMWFEMVLRYIYQGGYTLIEDLKICV